MRLKHHLTAALVVALVAAAPGAIIEFANWLEATIGEVGVAGLFITAGAAGLYYAVLCALAEKDRRS